MQSKDSGSASTVSPKESNSKSDPQQDGTYSGGGGRGGGQPSQNSGTGGPGQHTGAEQGNGVSAGKGQGENSDKAGADKLADHRTGHSSGNEKGPGSESTGRPVERRPGPAIETIGRRQGSIRPRPARFRGQEQREPQRPRRQLGFERWRPTGIRPQRPTAAAWHQHRRSGQCRLCEKAIRHGLGFLEKRQSQSAQGTELDSGASPATCRSA